MKTHIELSAANLVHNLEEFHKLTDGKKIMFAVKGNAYGHGLKEVVSITRQLDFVDYYAVDTLAEASIVRSIEADKKILVIGWADNAQLEEIISNRFELVVPSVDYLNRVEEISSRLNVNARVHLKVETGISRLGMFPREIVAAVNSSTASGEGSRYRHVDMVGIYSHFANIEDTTDHSFAEHQLGVFNRLLDELRPFSETLLKHFSCSASALLFPKTHFDIIRIGISAYGFWPSKPTYVSYIEKKRTAIQLEPVLSWYSKVAQVKELEKGEAIGYGLTYKTFDRSKIIVVPVGYYDGYDRRLSGSATIIINGVNAPVRGRVCMNMFMAEVTHIKTVQPGDRVVLIGSGGGEMVTADHLA
ncbi:MAG: alanine racemase, partial [bacterium]|nr:alanine racemase [bacterium]